jgi:hypothetical protein
MTQLCPTSANHIRASVQQWFTNRMHECAHCCQCDAHVTLWDSCCPICGQQDPARHSKSVAVQLLLGFALLAIVVSFIFLVF